jgi:hypothetical protein
MAAPANNQFWKNRSVHGRDMLFESHELLWKTACEYFNWCDGHPWWRNEPIKSGDRAGQIMKVAISRPYTLAGLCIYLKASRNYWKEFRKNKNLSEDFLAVIDNIEEIIYTQKFEGAAVGAFNANIISRDLGLADKSELTGPDGGPLQMRATSDIDITKLPTDVLMALMNARKPADE